jgi:hypothetical protein
MAEASKPRYAERGGEICIRQPLRMTRTTMYAWLLEADWGALQRMCDVAFNRVSGGALEYRPLLPVAMLVAADIGRGQSLDPVDERKGWMSERDMGFWVPVARGRQRGPVFEIDAIAWYHPYLFVDNVAALVTGRETYGFHKESATCVIPRGAADPGFYSVTTLVIPTFTPETEGLVTELYRVTRTDGGLRGDLDGAWHSAAEAFVEIERWLRGRFAGRADFPWPSWELIASLLKDLTEGIVPMAFLKQFRDIADPTVACYQAIVEAPSKLVAWHGGGLLGEHTLTLQQFESHPIVAELGLAGPKLPTGLGFWTRFDFDLGTGKVLWQAP